jgi:hypothetical protein
LDKAADEVVLRNKLNQGFIPGSLIPLCNRYHARLAFLPTTATPPTTTKSSKELNLNAVRLEAPPAERELSGRDVIVASNMQILHILSAHAVKVLA